MSKIGRWLSDHRGSDGIKSALTDCGQWLRRHAWFAGTAGTAALAFIITFFAVAAATGDDDTPAPAAGAVTRSSPVPPGLSASDDAALPPEQPRTTDTPTSTDEARSADLTVEPGDPDGQTQAPRPPRPLPEFDEDALIHGGSGDEGAILGGPGIVASSAADSRTDWELIIPSAQLRADIVKVGLTRSGAMGAPDNPHVIGWWSDGPAPGKPGNVLLDGHRDFNDKERNVGTGVCWELPNTQLGDFILVRDNATRVNHLYLVIETTSVGWESADGVEYLQPSRYPLLTLITCEGSFDRDELNYSNRRIVVAQMTDTIPFPSS